MDEGRGLSKSGSSKKSQHQAQPQPQLKRGSLSDTLEEDHTFIPIVLKGKKLGVSDSASSSDSQDKKKKKQIQRQYEHRHQFPHQDPEEEQDSENPEIRSSYIPRGKSSDYSQSKNSAKSAASRFKLVSPLEDKNKKHLRLVHRAIAEEKMRDIKKMEKQYLSKQELMQNSKESVSVAELQAEVENLRKKVDEKNADLKSFSQVKESKVEVLLKEQDSLRAKIEELRNKDKNMIQYNLQNEKIRSQIVKLKKTEPNTPVEEELKTKELELLMLKQRQIVELIKKKEFQRAEKMDKLVNCLQGVQVLLQMEKEKQLTDQLRELHQKEKKEELEHLEESISMGFGDEMTVPLEEMAEDTDQPGTDPQSPSNPDLSSRLKKYDSQDFLMVSLEEDETTNSQKRDKLFPMNEMKKFNWEKAIPILLKIGKAYANYGAPAHRLEKRMLILSESIGIWSTWAALPSLLTVSFGKQDGLDTITKVIPLNSNICALGKEYLIDCLIDDIILGKMSLFEAETRLEEIIVEPNLYHRSLLIFAFGIESAAASTLFFNGNLLEFAVSFCLGLIVGLGDWFSSMSSNFALLSDIITAIAIAFISVHISYFIDICFQGIVLSGVVWNLPGISIAISMHELASGNPVSGAVRLFSALFSAIKLAFGVAIGTKLAFWLPQDSSIANCHRDLSQWLDTIWLSLVTLGFVIILGAHFKQWPGMFLASVVSYLASFGLKQVGPRASELTPIVAAFSSTLVGNIYARLTRSSSIPYVMAGIIPLVPGSLALKAALLVESDVTIGISLSFSMLTVALQLTIGVFVATLIVFPRQGLAKL